MGAILLLFASCASVRGPQAEVPQAAAPSVPASVSRKPLLRLTFAGDLMAHAVNFEMDDYSLIYKDIESIIRNDDLTFVNLETPVCAERPYETYPTFNVHPAYADAAVSAGFDVFSLANNHANDQGKAGVAATHSYFAQKPGVWAAGIRASKDEAISWQYIKKDGWTILFAAVTELLNSPRDSERIDFFPPSKRDALLETLTRLRREHPCDIFVLSFHSAEEEYVRTVAKSRRAFYHRLLDAGVDIVWANHIHAAREWEALEQAGKLRRLVFYSAGNTISGQRTRYNFDNPAADRDYTGDGFLYRVFIAQDDSAPDAGASGAPGAGPSWEIARLEPVLITTYRDSANRYTIKRLTPAFINSLRQSGRPDEAAYFEKRRALMERIAPPLLP